VTTRLSPAQFLPVFDWTPPRTRKFALISFISGSAALHALCFYVFQIIYPPTVALRPPPARVTMITAASEEGRLLLQWIEAEDPALSSTTQRPPNASFSLTAPEHVPSYLRRTPALREPPYQADLRIPSSRPPAPVPVLRNQTPSPPASIPTAVKFATEAESLGQPKSPVLRFTAAPQEPPQAAEFRVAISPNGNIQFCALKNSSGLPKLDEQARHYLLLCRFSIGENLDRLFRDGLFWTSATFEWGNDIAASSAAETGSPPP